MFWEGEAFTKAMPSYHVENMVLDCFVEKCVNVLRKDCKSAYVALQSYCTFSIKAAIRNVNLLCHEHRYSSIPPQSLAFGLTVWKALFIFAS